MTSNTASTFTYSENIDMYSEPFNALAHDYDERRCGMMSPGDPEPGVPSGCGSAPKSSSVCSFLGGVVDNCYASRFYARIMEFYLLEMDFDIDGVVLCPLSDCRNRYSTSKDMLRHLKDCAYMARGKFICPYCNKDEKFRTAFKRKCSWNRTCFSTKIQKGLQASVKFLGMSKPVQCPQCHGWLHEKAVQSSSKVSETLFSTSDHEPTGLRQFPVSKSATLSKPDIYAPVPPSHGAFELFDDSPIVKEMGDTRFSRVELGDTGLTPVDITNKYSHFAHSPITTTVPSSLSTSCIKSPGSISPPSTVHGSYAGTTVSPTCSDGSSATGSGSKMHRLSNVFRPSIRGTNLALNVPDTLPTVEQATAPALDHRSDLYRSTPADSAGMIPTRPQTYSASALYYHSDQLFIETEWPGSLTLGTDFGAPDSLLLNNGCSPADPEALTPRTMPNYPNSHGDLFDNSSLNQSPESGDSLATSDTQTGASLDGDAGCSKCDYKPKGKKENYRSYLSKHIKSHNCTKVECPVCKKEFTRHDNMTHHMGKAHPDCSFLRKRPGSNGGQSGSQRKRPSRAA
ncbi:hypothetical protein SCARD494_07453 [Seiridium cardinale]